MNYQLPRREFIRLLALSGASLASGCCITAPSIPDDSPPLSTGLLAEDPAALLSDSGIPAIDAHAHFFNASDMNAAGYLAGPVMDDAPPALKKLIEILHPVVEQMARNFTPSAYREMEYLQSMDSELAGLSRNDRLERLDRSIIRRKDEISEELYRRLRRTEFPGEFRASLQRGNFQIQGSQEFSQDAIRAALDYGLDQTGLFESTAAFGGPAQDHPAGVIAFVGHMFHYRIENIRIFQKAFADPNRTVKVAAAVYAMVDFDHWLKGCEHPPSRLSDQVLLVEKLVKLTDGFVLPLMAYNPWSDIENDGESLELFERAVRKHGFVGAKIYPPICFSPSVKAGRVLQDKWPDPKKVRLALEQFYRKCLELDVPVMAHANSTRGAVPACNGNSSPKNWDELITTQDFNKLRINAGHFGGTHPSGTPADSWSREFVGVMRKAPHFYADIGYWDNLASGDQSAVNKLTELLRMDIGQGEKASQRVMFGSDWFMIAQEKDWPSYADNVRQRLKSAGIPSEDLERMMYRNALHLFGLNESTPGLNRQRLLEHYRQQEIAPNWWALT